MPVEISTDIVVGYILAETDLIQNITKICMKGFIKNHVVVKGGVGGFLDTAGVEAQAEFVGLGVTLGYKN